MGFWTTGAASSGGSNAVNTTLDALEWRGGEWFHPAEAFYNSDWPNQHSKLTVCYAKQDHKASFLISQATRADDWGNLMHPMRTFEGHLVLQDFWDMQVYNEYRGQFDDCFDEIGAGPGNTSFWNCCELLGLAFRVLTENLQVLLERCSTCKNICEKHHLLDTGTLW